MWGWECAAVDVVVAIDVVLVVVVVFDISVLCLLTSVRSVWC